MSNASTSRLRGKVFDPCAPRRDFVIEVAPKKVKPRTAGESVTGAGPEPVLISLPRVRWLERGAP